MSHPRMAAASPVLLSSLTIIHNRLVARIARVSSGAARAGRAAGHAVPVPEGGVHVVHSALRSNLWLLLALCSLHPEAALAQDVRSDLYVANGAVFSAVVSGNTIYIGGAFTQVGPATGGAVPLDAATGQPLTIPQVTGTVWAAAPDGSGGWYVGGDFSHVGGIPRANLAHFEANGALSAWNPGTNGSVHALAVDGNTVYVGGYFGSVGGLARSNLAAVDATTGEATAWVPNANSSVYALAVGGSAVYAGGSFTSVGGQARNYIAALDATNGNATAWAPNASAVVYALAVSGSTVYAGGWFTSIGGQTRNRAAALSAATALATAWNPNVGGGPWVSELAVSGGTVYLGGAFSSVGGVTRNNIAAVDATTGTVSAWNPNADAQVEAMAVSGSTVYAGGSFTSVGGVTRNNIAALDATTGAVTAWTPNANNIVYALLASGSTVYAGGTFSSIGGQARNGIAALDATTGAATAWDPNANGVVYALTVSGGTVYAGGSFTNIGGQARNRIAAMNATTGAATAWDPNANGVVYALTVSGGTVYAGGSFTNIGGQARNNIAALDATTGSATAWNPDANNLVYTLAVSGSTVYAGGAFTSIRGQARNRIAALNAMTGSAIAWNPNANSTVYALSVSGGAVYAAGFFSGIGGSARDRIAALDAATGAATAWNPAPIQNPVSSVGPIRALAMNENNVYAGGTFAGIGGFPHSYIAGISTPLSQTTIDTSPSGLAITVDGTDYTAPKSFSWAAGSPHTIAVTSPQAGTPGTRYKFDHWSDSGAASHSVNAPAGAASFIASFTTEYHLTTSSLPSAAGTVTANPPSGDGYYAAGASVQLTATANAGFFFSGWDGDLAGGTSPQSLTLDAPGTVTGVFAMSAVAAPSNVSPVVDPYLWVPNRQVNAMVRVGQTIYIAGPFTQVGPASGGGVPFDPITGAPMAGFPKVSGYIRAVANDGSGGWYIGGLFTAVGGKQRFNLAHINADLSVSSWNPNSNFTYFDPHLGDIRALAVSGSTLYVAGSFDRIGTAMRNRLAALDATTGSVLGWDPDANGTPLALAVSGSVVYAAGDFDMIGGQSRGRMAALDAATGSPTSWNPNADGRVLTFAIAGSTIYVGGLFTHVGGQPRNYLAAVDAGTGNPTPWDPNPDHEVYALGVSGSTVYAGGRFTTIGGAGRWNLAALDAMGNATAWDPQPLPRVSDGSEVDALTVSGSTIYFGGHFHTVHGDVRDNAAAVDATTGVPTAWDPRPSSNVYSFAVNGSRIYAGGDFSSVSAVTRNHAAALNVTTGEATAWDPDVNLNGGVSCLAVVGSTVYIGGPFTTVHGEPRLGLAAVDATTGVPTSWDPQAAGGLVEQMVVNGSNLYLGGQFTTIGGQPRKLLAAVDLTSGAPTSWNPNASGTILPSDIVFAMAIHGSAVYVGGQFTSAGGQRRTNLAALDLATGAATAWTADADDIVYAIVPTDETVYVGGVFHHLAGVVRNTIGALNPTTGAVTQWAPNDRTSGINVLALTLSGPTLYVGGSFDNFNGQNRNNLAEVDAVTGAVSPWAPDLTANVGAMALVGNTVYAGGAFAQANGLPQAALAAIANMSITELEPAHGGNGGPITVTITGAHLLSGATARLKRSTHADIVATSVIPAEDSYSFDATFNLTNTDPGAWDVVVVNPDGQIATRLEGFTIEAVEAPQLRVDIVGPTQIQANQPTAFDLVIDNPGNVDALAVPVWVAGIPGDAAVALDFPVTPAPQTGDEPDWSQVPQTVTSPVGRVLPVLLPRVHPGTTTLTIELSVPASDPTLSLRAAITPPWGDGTSLVPCLVDGAVIANAACARARLADINTFLLGTPGIEALSGIGVWAKIASECEGAADLTAAVTKATDILDLMARPIEQQGSVPSSCTSVLAPRWLEVLAVSVQSLEAQSEARNPRALSTGGSITIIGARGIGPNRTLPEGKAIPYSIRFQNASNATGAVQRLVIDDALDAGTLDLSTLSLEAITFGGVRLTPPPGQTEYHGVALLAAGLEASVKAKLDPQTNHLIWQIQATSTATDQPPTNPFQGFLPPGVGGSVLFTAKAMPLAPGTPIQNGATVAFDGGAAQSTGPWSNGADNTPPASHVLPLSAVQTASPFTVSWVADGAPPDLKDFTIYVAMDGQAYSVWRQNTTSTSDGFVPQRGHQYSFYSVARDAVGNIESAPAGPDATTYSTTDVDGPVPPRLTLEGSRPNPAYGTLSIWFTLKSRKPAALELFDIAGRRLERRQVGSLGPGQHVLQMRASPALRPGLYFLRLASEGVVLRSRVVMLR